MLPLKIMSRLIRGSFESLVGADVRQRLQHLRPFGTNLTTYFLGPRFPVPSDLLHVVVELDATAFGIQRVGRLVDSGVEVWRDLIGGLDTILFSENARPLSTDRNCRPRRRTSSPRYAGLARAPCVAVWGRGPSYDARCRCAGKFRGGLCTLPPRS